MPNPYSSAVARGAALLDQVKPRWWEQIPHPQNLDMEDPCGCVLGHVYDDLPGGFWSAIKALFGDNVSEDMWLGCGGKPGEYGFTVLGPYPPYERGWSILKAAWMTEIQQRKESHDANTVRPADST